MAKIKQSNYILKENLAIWLSKSVKIKAYLFSIFNENYNYLFLYLSFFWVQITPPPPCYRG